MTPSKSSTRLGPSEPPNRDDDAHTVTAVSGVATFSGLSLNASAPASVYANGRLNGFIMTAGSISRSVRYAVVNLPGIATRCNRFSRVPDAGSRCWRNSHRGARPARGARSA